MQDFSGIDEKLKRAEESIYNLYSEMKKFLEEGDYPVFPENDRELHLKAIEYHKNRAIPPRFSVLAGEIIHQLRSCFDHVVWHFSMVPVQNHWQIGFPVVFEKRPTDKRSCEKFEAKIQGIADPSAKALIQRLQPYNAADPTDDPLWLIHSFDIVDKHKELILCEGTSSVALPREMEGILKSYQREHPELSPVQVARHFKHDGPSQPCVSFTNFGRREVESVTEGLIRLFYYTNEVVEEFRNI
jgi:hypothetical protein